MSGKTYTLKQFSVRLSQLRKETRETFIKNAAFSGAFVIEAHSKINAIEQFKKNSQGNLASSIQSVEGEVKPNRVEILVGPSNVIYARIQELGGIIRPLFKKFLHWVDENGKHHQALRVVIPPRPYMRPAVDDNNEEIVEAMATSLRKDIEASI